MSKINPSMERSKATSLSMSEKANTPQLCIHIRPQHNTRKMVNLKLSLEFFALVARSNWHNIFNPSTFTLCTHIYIQINNHSFT